MEKKFKFQADPQDKGNFKYLMVGIPLALVGLFLILIPKLNLAVNNPNVAGYTDPKYAWLFFGIGLFLIFVYVFIKFLVSWLAKLEITGANLIIKNPAKPLNQISIADISSVALRYEVASIRISGPNLVPFASLIKSYRYYVRQWGDLVQTKNGEIYEIKQNIQNLEDFIKE